MEIKARATSILKELYGENARFRDGQYEAIEATLTKHRTLVVQKTGWGKSLVYFTCTKLLREDGKGVTLVVSPLLALMDNQMESALHLDLKCEALNSNSKDRRGIIIQMLKDNQLDLLLVTPETLFKEDIQSALKDIEIGLFVVDEAHCISDWGHDFRLDYGNLHKIIQALPKSVPLLATTATANDRVIQDLTTQLGEDVYLSRGSLMRESLAIQVVKLKDRAERYAWILKNINKLPGSGIIYCLTRRDCDFVADFLNVNGVKAMPYYSGNSDENNTSAMLAFQDNKIKAIVATIKLGMGYDKDDIGFVIHFQQPSNIVGYYQQIGRAGRKLDNAYVFLMTGVEDEQINEYFINTAFPTTQECDSVIEIIGGYDDGVKLGSIITKANFRKSRIEKTLDFLLNEGAITKIDSKYYLTAKLYTYDKAHYDEVTNLRKIEMKEMQELVSTKECYSKFIINCLDDKSQDNCGKCVNCIGHDLIDLSLTVEEKGRALEYINALTIAIEPRKQWAETATPKKRKIEFLNEQGLCLSKFGDVGYGALVKRDKRKNTSFCDELVGKSAEMLRSVVKAKGIECVTCPPSLRSDMVEDFAKRLASSLKLPFIVTLAKSPADEQIKMENSSFQCDNAYKSFSLIQDIELPKRILLVDDIVDSKWTLTVCGYKLMQGGAEMVLPFALADNSAKED